MKMIWLTLGYPSPARGASARLPYRYRSDFATIHKMGNLSTNMTEGTCPTIADAISMAKRRFWEV
jgi:hypothetical protein